MTTAAGRQVAGGIERSKHHQRSALSHELEGLEGAVEQGRLAVVRYFMEEIARIHS